jgi:hypothetical protein
MKKYILTVLTLAVVLVFTLIGGTGAVSATSGNLIANGDFATGNFTDWTVFQTENGATNETATYYIATFETCNSTDVYTWEGGGISQTFSAPAGTWILTLSVMARPIDDDKYPRIDNYGPKVEVLMDGMTVDDHTFNSVWSPLYIYPRSVAGWAFSITGNFPTASSHEIKIRITTAPVLVPGEPLIRTYVDNVKFRMVSLLDGDPVWRCGEHFYMVVPGAITWEDANSAADRGATIDGTYYRGHLATITSSEENAFVYDLLTEKVGSGSRGWIGAYQLPDQSGVSEGWQWVTGETMTDYTNWDPGSGDSPIPSPNDAGGPESGDPPTTTVPNPNYYGLEDDSENYMEMRGKGYWDDLGGTINNSSYVIEFEPIVGAITGPTGPVAIDTAVDFSAPIFDYIPGTVSWDWGDGPTSGATVDTAGHFIRGIHTYTSPGIYTVQLMVGDGDGGYWTATQFQYVVVYDASAGFVTGGGWINSPAGAYTADPNLTGKANFGFVSKYQKGATVPSGNTEFQFKAGNLNFKSSSYEWLVIAGARSQFKGEGTINDAGNYGFMLTAIDGQINGGGGSDKFRIKIWDGETIVYDNQIGDLDYADPSTLLGGGSIVIHK